MWSSNDLPSQKLIKYIKKYAYKCIHSNNVYLYIFNDLHLLTNTALLFSIFLHLLIMWLFVWLHKDTSLVWHLWCDRIGEQGSVAC